MKDCLAKEDKLKPEKKAFLEGFIQTLDVWIITMKKMGKV